MLLRAIQHNNETRSTGSSVGSSGFFNLSSQIILKKYETGTDLPEQGHWPKKF